MDKGHTRFIAALVLIWLLLIAIVNPIGNFPLNDDWQYSRPAYYLVQHGFYYSPDYYSPIIAAQVLWGSLFCLPFGFSFTTLRISTLVLGLAGVIVLYLLAYNVSNNKRLSFLTALLIMINPLYFSLANSFMTDVPFLVFTLLSIFFFTRYLQASLSKYIYIAVALSLVATLIRQFGVVIPLAYGITAMVKNKPKLKGYIMYLIPAVLVATVLNFTLWWLTHIGSPLQPYEGSTITGLLSEPGEISTRLFERSGDIIYYSGFFLLPLLLYITPHTVRALSKRQKMGVGIFVLVFVLSLIHMWKHFVFVGNVINNLFIGPKTLRDVSLLWTNLSPGLPAYVVNIFRGVALLGGLLLLINIGAALVTVIKEFRKKKLSDISYGWIFIALYFLGYAFLMFVSRAYFDRYLLNFIPISALLVVAGNRQNITIKAPLFIFSGLFIIGLSLFSLLGTHDYIEWNRQRWKALDYLTKEMKVPATKIDGGYEFNGWYMANSHYHPVPQKSWWFVNDDEYMISFGPLDGYEAVKKFSCNSYLMYGVDAIYVLHRKDK